MLILSPQAPDQRGSGHRQAQAGLWAGSPRRRLRAAAGRLAATAAILVGVSGCLSPGLDLGAPAGCWARQWDTDNDGRVSFVEYDAFRARPWLGWVDRRPAALPGNPIDCVLPLTARPS